MMSACRCPGGAWTTRLICFSDDMDGLRKVPEGIPNAQVLHEDLYKPLTVVRDQAYWATFIAPRLQHRVVDEQLQVFLAATNTTYQHPCGYLLAHFFDFAFLIIELAVHRRHRNAIASLINAVGDEARKRGLQYGEADLPHTEEIDRAVSRLFGETLHLSDENTQMMARPISKICAPA